MNHKLLGSLDIYNEALARYILLPQVGLCNSGYTSPLLEVKLIVIVILNVSTIALSEARFQEFLLRCFADERA